MAKMPGETHPLKRGVVGDFQDIRIFQRIEEFLWKPLPAGQIYGYYRRIVKGIG